jgi:hypothetical protein
VTKRDVHDKWRYLHGHPLARMDWLPVPVPVDERVAHEESLAARRYLHESALALWAYTMRVHS